VTSPNVVANISVNLVQSEDVGVTQQALPATIAPGGESVLLLNVSNAGPGTGATTVTDAVPSGLTIEAVSAGDGTCTISGQSVSCKLASAPATIAVVVSAAKVGSYANTASVSSALTDPNLANNSSSATLTVAVPAATGCRLVPLAKVPLSQAKSVIRALDCKVGKVKAKASRSIRKGDVISTSPRPGKGKTVAAGTKVAIVYSSGKPKKK
jgi:hypothetical protein